MSGGNSKAFNQQRGYKGNVNLVTPGVAGVEASSLGMPTALLQASFELADVYTCEFSIIPVVAGATIRCLAILNWKVGGVQIQRMFDIAQGTTIQGVAEAMDCQVQDLTKTVFGDGGQAYNVSVVVARGTRASTSQPPVYYNDGYAVPNLGSAMVPVPQNAGIISAEVVVVDQAAPNTNPIGFQVAHSNGTVSLKVYSPSLAPGFIHLAPGTVALQLNNFSGDLCFATVSFGVDG